MPVTNIGRSPYNKSIPTRPERLDNTDPTRLNAKSDRIRLSSIVIGADGTRSQLSKLAGFCKNLYPIASPGLVETEPPNRLNPVANKIGRAAP